MSELGAGTGSSYPTGIDTDTTLEVNSPNAGKTKARAECINDANAAIIAIETALGTTPQGTKTDVKTFLQVDHGTDGTHKANIVLTTPTIASFVNANHNHSNAAGGGFIKGQAIQTVITQTGALATGTTAIPDDDTIPQNTEGDEYMTVTITPTSATNILWIEVVVNCGNSGAGQNICVALFQDTTANALKVSTETNDSASGSVCIPLCYQMTSGTTSATTFKIRIGSAAGTITFNGRASGRKYGGALNSFIRVTEIQV